MHHAQPYCGSTRAAVKSELHVSVHQADGQEVPAGRVVAVEQRPVRGGRAERHLELGEGQVAARRLRPGDDGVGKHRLVEERRGQRETCAGEQESCKRILNFYLEHAGTFKWSVNKKQMFSELDSSLPLFLAHQAGGDWIHSLSWQSVPLKPSGHRQM